MSYYETYVYYSIICLSWGSINSGIFSFLSNITHKKGHTVGTRSTEVILNKMTAWTASTSCLRNLLIFSLLKTTFKETPVQVKSLMRSGRSMTVLWSHRKNKTLSLTHLECFLKWKVSSLQCPIKVMHRQYKLCVTVYAFISWGKVC